ncbi:MAG TPA: hypothetical protein VG406_16815 [Isosphaeraceae bacterium]|jgi:hypothetical protein|nr:hypothetical protein [Isosphaeraceae bacterium]
MPRQNRVTPAGAIVAVPARGTMMGNRGVLHDADGRIRRPWQVRRWLICVLEFRGRRRTVMAPNRYTELFFLDEATGLAAGHRPCFECRRARYLAFRDAWATGNLPGVRPEAITAGMMDDRLHAERVGPGRSKLTDTSSLDALPDGVFVTRDGPDGDPLLVLGGALLHWSPGGYHRRRSRPRGTSVTVLTPKSTVAAIRAGYMPEIHPSAFEA